ncbi:MAG: TldD/PmbA family protein [Bacilli bacterium]|nr:TldD/PmbA family protein [Bacilli bacterium]
MRKEELEEYLNLGMSTGADAVELYYEESKKNHYRYNDSKLDTVDSSFQKGLGIRIIKGEESFYTSTSILTKKNITICIQELLKNFPQELGKKVFLNDLEDRRTKPIISHGEYPIEKKKQILSRIDEVARSVSPLVVQVSAGILEMDKEFIVANSSSKYVTGNSFLTRVMAAIYAEKDGRKEHEFTDFGRGMGYEFLEGWNLEKQIHKTANTAVEKLDAVDFKGGKMPVVIAPGFGAVIFHEACGHGLEATSVAPHLSVFSDDYGKMVATSKVTLIDDGTISGAWGSSLVDDEGRNTEKNILIENGVLKTFLVDSFHSEQMHMDPNGCGRRESYRYAPTSRMSNTYLAIGKDKIENMIQSIDYGVYCEKMSGGSVNPATGDFNFAVDTARLIENGKVKHLLKGITLIGNSKDILKNVEMVSDDLTLSAGFCGSKSGMIPVTIGQPTIKVSSILVGGKEE